VDHLHITINQNRRQNSMKSFRKVAIAAMVAVVPALAVGTAWANTELVPGARLVAPYWDVTGITGGGGDRGTLLLITNVSKVANLQRSAVSLDQNGVCNLGNGAASKCGVHLEFYDKTCENVNVSIDLSKWDIDQLDLNVDADMSGPRGLPNKLGWVDIDVRKSEAGTDDAGVQANVLMGTVVIGDSGSDFAVAYPMASSIGSSNTAQTTFPSIGGDIVTRRNGGFADKWTGGYESFPARVFVPMYFAEFNNYGQTFTSTLAIAGPAQAISGGEAPGQELGEVEVADEAILVDVSVAGFDACENPWSDSIEEHYVIGSLDELFASNVDAANYKTTGCTLLSADTDRTATNPFKGGWIDLKNRARSANTNAGIVGAENSYERGLVGVLVQQATTATTFRGDATRLWGDCAYGNSTTSGGTESVQTNRSIANPSGGTACRPSYSLVEDVNHADIAP
jgi:hypothetical protein